MKKLSLTHIARHVKSGIARHSPEILTGLGIAGMVTTAVMAVRATPKALGLIEEAKGEANDLTPVDKIKTAWQCYIPSAAMGTVSAACLICASSINLRRNTAMATAYGLAESALKEYQDKTLEALGEKKEQKVRDAIAKDKLEKDPVHTHEVIETLKGSTLCYDSICGRYFRSDIDRLRKIENDLNRRMLDEMYISLNDFYYEIGMGGTEIGDDLGWHVDDGLIDLRFSSQLTEDGTPCLVVSYRIAPQYNYYRR